MALEAPPQALPYELPPIEQIEAIKEREAARATTIDEYTRNVEALAAQLMQPGFGPRVVTTTEVQPQPTAAPAPAPTPGGEGAGRGGSAGGGGA